MATLKERTIILTWESGTGFEMETKLDDGDWDMVNRIAEDDHFASLWPDTVTHCKKYFEREINKISAEMLPMPCSPKGIMARVKKLLRGAWTTWKEMGRALVKAIDRKWKE